MQNEYPPNRVLVSKSIPLYFQISPNDIYTDVYTSAERDATITKYKSLTCLMEHVSGLMLL